MSSPAPFFDCLHVIFDDACPAALNMAIDQALLERSSTPVLRVYDWEHPTISIGYSHAYEAQNYDLPVVRRWTGGGTVRHECDSTYAVVVPSGHGWGRTRPAESYRLLHEALASCLNHHCCGPCRLADDGDIKPGAFCFEAPAKYDVMRVASKVAGAAQRRGKLGLLHQGSVSLPMNRDFWMDFAGRISATFTAASEASEEVMQRALALTRTRYATESWLRLRRDEACAGA